VVGKGKKTTRQSPLDDWGADFALAATLALDEKRRQDETSIVLVVVVIVALLMTNKSRTTTRTILGS
jgi:hypothetical protein